jgi:hypothetical protein
MGQKIHEIAGSVDARGIDEWLLESTASQWRRLAVTQLSVGEKGVKAKEASAERGFYRPQGWSGWWWAPLVGNGDQQLAGSVGCGQCRSPLLLVTRTRRTVGLKPTGATVVLGHTVHLVQPTKKDFPIFPNCAQFIKYKNQRHGTPQFSKHCMSVD